MGYHDATMDTMIEASQSMVDNKELSVLWKEMFAIITDANPYLFLFIPDTITAVNKKIKNIEPTPSGIWHNYIEWEK